MKKQSRKSQKARSPAASLSGDKQLSLAGFRSTDVPDMTPLKFVYSDYRVLTAATNQAEYSYRANSVFDPDQTGVGGQPDGFDQWKTLYDVYRVVAVEVEVQAIGNGANTNGLLAVAPSDTTGGFSSAEELAGLRYGKAASYSQTSTARVKFLVRMSQLFGRNDDSILADPNCGALVSTNPVSQFYIVIGIETGNSATGQTMVWTKLTYYTRMEEPIAVLDTSSLHRSRIRAGLPPVLKPPKKEAETEPVVAESTYTSRGPVPVTQAAPALDDISTQLASLAAAVRDCRIK